MWFSGYSSNYSVLPANELWNFTTQTILNLESKSTELVKLLNQWVWEGTGYRKESKLQTNLFPNVYPK